MVWETTMQGHGSRLEQRLAVLQHIKLAGGSTPLVLGFAYSLDPDGGPGLYNRILARTILYDWAEAAASGRWPPMGVQWEIRDALDDPQLAARLSRARLTSALRNRLGMPPPPDSLRPPGDTVTVPPFGPIMPLSRASALGLRRLLRDALITPGDRGPFALAEALARQARSAGYGGSDDEVLSDAFLSGDQAASQLNRFVAAEQDFHQRVYQPNGGAAVVLRGRQREDFGPIGFEDRRLPARQTAVTGFQQQRVNRLLLDAIITDREILPAPAYLSTRGVLEHVFRELDPPTDQTPVVIYASPVHAGRCLRQFVEYCWSRGWNVTEEQVQLVYAAEIMEAAGWRWETGTAQVWCRSQASRQVYEANAARLA